MSRPIFLIGYMASGKTTLGRALARATDRRFVDLDDFIEARVGKTVTQIFADGGENTFRKLESDALSEIITEVDGDLIVACGGGTPCFGDNLDRINAAGLSVWLDAPADVIVRRLLLDRNSRPLVASLSADGELKDYVEANLARRHPYYRRAAERFDSSRLETVDEVAESVALFIDTFLSRNFSEK